MKTRSGFVSNSSSSSFVAIGIKTTSDDLRKIFPTFDDEDFDIWELEGTEDYPDVICPGEDDEYIIGKEIASWDDDEWEYQEVDIDEIRSDPKIKSSEEKLGKNAILICGMRAS
jgi:hypothetical protein